MWAVVVVVKGMTTLLSADKVLRSALNVSLKLAYDRHKDYSALRSTLSIEHRVGFVCTMLCIWILLNCWYKEGQGQYVGFL